METGIVILTALLFFGVFALFFCLADKIPGIRKEQRMRNFVCAANVVLHAIKELPRNEDNANFIRDMILELQNTYPDLVAEIMQIRVAFRERWDLNS
jgi:hypothetical protein